MKTLLLCLVAIGLIGCGMSHEQKVFLAQTQKEVERLESQSIEEQRKSDAVKQQMEWLDRLSPQQRLNYVILELGRETAETNRNTQGGVVIGCLLGLVRCRD